MEEGFLLGRIAGERGNIVAGYAQVTGFVEANFANAALAFFD